MGRRLGGRRCGLARCAAVAGGLVLLGATTAADAGTTYYHYDGLGRLVSICDAAAGKRIRYSYDADGNRTSWTVTTASCSANAAPVAVNDTIMGTFSVGSPLVADVLANDTEPDGDELKISSANCVSSGCTVFITRGSGTVLGQGTQRDSLVVTATTEGPKTITYTITDGHGGSATATLVVDGFSGGGMCGPYSCIPF